MEQKLGGKTITNGHLVADTKAAGKRVLEWDLNDWKWDGDVFRANPLNPEINGCRNSQCFPIMTERQLSSNVNVSNGALLCSEANRINENETSDSRNKRTVVVAHGNEELINETAPLNLRLGEQVYPIAVAGNSGNNSRNTGSPLPICLVEGCMADLSTSRDYNRRHKVCEVHSKVPQALVGNVIQRFCQQCSRFHALQEFDGEKRSCRKRLDGHNKRRRKTHAGTTSNVGSLTNDINASQILNLLLQMLSNMHTNGSAQPTDQNQISQLMRNLAAFSDGSNTSWLLQGSQGSPNVGISNGIPEQDLRGNQEPSQTTLCAHSGSQTRENQSEILQTTPVPQPIILQATGGTLPAEGSVQEASVEKLFPGGIDLNVAYIGDSQDCLNDLPNGVGSVTGTYWAEQTLPSPPPTSGNSGSTAGEASSGSGDPQCRTDRIIFKLFDKDPNDLPSVLRTQILDWLSQTPTDIEGYIRPGCVVLTLYLRLSTALWEQFSHDVSSSLTRLLDLSNGPFWKTGWIYTRIQQRGAFICDGQVMLDMPLPFKSPRSQILSISPIALPAGETAELVVRGSNLSGPTSRLLCAIEGKYLLQENCYRLVEGTDFTTEEDEIQSLSFSCSMPNVLGRGFIEVEDYDLTGCFFPFIVAEPEVCYEICMLEQEMRVGSDDKASQLEDGEKDAKYNKALDFIHEMGWLLHRNRVRFKENQQASPLNLLPFKRLKWLIEFSIDHDWRAVLRKLLDLLFSEIVDTGDYASIEDGLADIALLHTAVRRNNRPMVEFLLMYLPNKNGDSLVLEQKKPDSGPLGRMLFRPDVAGVGGLTPMHIAASSAGLENVLDALLEDPGMVGIEAWKNARDSTGLTPCDYASLRGHYRYLHLVQKKANQKSTSGHVVLDIPSLSHLESNKIQTDKSKSKSKSKSKEFVSFYTEKPQVPQSCKLCGHMSDYRIGAAPVTMRPLMISLVAIAVVCVCTALLFKSGPDVHGIFGPFRWDSLKFGSI